MEHPQAESPDNSDFEPQIDESWNERKRLSEKEFDLRSEIQALLVQGASLEKFQEARQRERENRAALARNDEHYDAQIEGWAAIAFKAAGSNG
jgi:hypothetical protein